MKAAIMFLGSIALANPIFGQDTTYNEIIKQLLRVDELDQRYRNQIEDVQAKYGGDSKELKSLFRNMKVADSLNLIEVEAIIKKYGWLGYTKIGNQANTALFMVIQHSDLKTQEKYLPIMQAAVKNGNAKAHSLALLEDRVALLEGKKQIYGSQVSWNMKTNTAFVAPLFDPDNVDKRRAEVGLPPLKDYLAEMEMTWDVEQYKKELPSLETEFFKPKK